jgi:hypothetical protein
MKKNISLHWLLVVVFVAIASNMKSPKKKLLSLCFFHSLYLFLILFTPTVQINHQTTGREGRKAIWPTKELKETQKLYRIKNCGVFFVSFPSLSLSKHFSACNIIRFIFIVIVIIVVWSGF